MTEEVVASRKKRHGCLTAYLLVMIIANSLTGLLYLLGADTIKQRLPNMPNWAFPVLIAIAIINLVCAFALFRWKKWGFWGFALSSLMVFALNLAIGLDIISAILGLVGVVVLFGVLHIGKEAKGWTQLE
ncbi:MAG TPA: hypothetical protein VNX27_05740 [Chthoniobacterales bacterium]|jgi:hypothetical protein|nr:hypothetical protein [Chthoniobacterales bacterium]